MLETQTGETVSFIVICRSEASKYPILASRTVFSTETAAEIYANGIPRGRLPIVVSGPFASLELPGIAA